MKPVQLAIPDGSAQTGFTMVELIVVIVVTGILAVTALTHVSNMELEQQAFRSSVKELLQHARRSAIASRRYQCVNLINGGSVLELMRDIERPENKVAINCTVALPLPAGTQGCAASHQFCAPAGSRVTGLSPLIFDPQGRLVSAPNVLAGTPSQLFLTGAAAIQITPATGYVR